MSPADCELGSNALRTRMGGQQPFDEAAFLRPRRESASFLDLADCRFATNAVASARDAGGKQVSNGT